MLTLRRSCQRASALILVALLGSFVLLWLQQRRRPEFLAHLHTRYSVSNFTERGVEGQRIELDVPTFLPDITDESDENGRGLNEKAMEAVTLDDYDEKNNADYKKNDGVSISEFASKQRQEQQNHLDEVYHVTEENSLSDYLSKNDHINDSTIKRQSEQQNHIVKKYAVTTFPAAIRHTTPSTSQLLRRFPKFMIIGFGKAGTKALFEALKLHPSLRGPEIERRYFSTYYYKGLVSYLVHLPDPAPGGFTIDKSPDYITQPNVPGRILEKTKNLSTDSSSLKFIVVLRNPIDRAMSEYLEWNVQNKVHHKPLLPSFSSMVLTATGKVKSSLAFVNSSCYAQHIRNWLQVFDKEQMCFVDGDKFISDPYEEVHALEQCMGLRPFFSRDNFVYHQRRGFYCFDVGSKHMCMNASKGRKHPVIPHPTSMKLKVFFHPWNEQLLNLTGREFTNWEDT